MLFSQKLVNRYNELKQEADETPPLPLPETERGGFRLLAPHSLSGKGGGGLGLCGISVFRDPVFLNPEGVQ